jgi:hypothetical protein
MKTLADAAAEDLAEEVWNAGAELDTLKAFRDLFKTRLNELEQECCDDRQGLKDTIQALYARMGWAMLQLHYGFKISLEDIAWAFGTSQREVQWRITKAEERGHA